LVTRPNGAEREEAAMSAFMAAVAVRLVDGGLARLRGGAKEREKASRRQGRPAARKKKEERGAEQGGRHGRGLRQAPTAPPWRSWPFHPSPSRSSGAGAVLRRGGAHAGVFGAQTNARRCGRARRRQQWRATAWWRGATFPWRSSQKKGAR
jgi:hypothetical protein